MTGLGKLPTLFILLMCAALFIKHLRQFGFCRLLDPREQLSGHLYSATGHVQRVGRATIRFTYPSFQKDYSQRGQWCAFPVHKGYYGKPAHHTGVSNLYGFCLANAKPPARSRDALGLISCLSSPRRAVWEDDVYLVAGRQRPAWCRYFSSV